MKTIFTSNQELLEVLYEHGINIIFDENMNMVMDDEDAERIDSIVQEFAPAALCDYCIEEDEDAQRPASINTLEQLVEYMNSDEYNKRVYDEFYRKRMERHTRQSDYDLCQSGGSSVNSDNELT